MSAADNCDPDPRDTQHRSLDYYAGTPWLVFEHEFVVQPRLAGHGPTLFAELSKRVDLRLVSRLDFGSEGTSRLSPSFPERWATPLSVAPPHSTV